ncbi:MAG: UTRA domain-containing protein [Bacteroidetes bacterium]|jgi:GntR family transcriptional regulator|nr:UTRA domain-containing protein [Bacteroidota bacterium]
MKIDQTSGIPLYKQIESYIRKEIESGKYDDGSFLPREQKLANKFGVSRNTVRQGIANLVNEGVLKRTPGKGTVLAQRTITTKLSEWHSFRNEMQKKGITVKDYFVKAEFEYAPGEVYQKLNVNKDKKLFKLERLRGDRIAPFVYFVSWFHPRTQLDENEDYTSCLYTILEEKHSVVPVYSEEELDAIEANVRIAEYLQIEKNKPILFRKRLVLDAGERPIEYNLGYYRSDKFKYSIRFERK